ncbi:hypothetical protein OH146_02885 [Salinibacterium sp. SYSU T00001]|uniref:hypothetical protein n=1 Tax=Homoserinimonas sedimenticola TaxID=2986805 RepID=UPI002235ECA9|nr:hypothetical protein [Salinibacterium sedimenticola]MCW4384714.1 hypothetical protein [Salinibacterium sedimenticola]
MALAGVAATPAAASPAPAKSNFAAVVEVCEGETLNTTNQDGEPLSAAEFEVAIEMVESFCQYQSTIRPFGVTYGDYVRNDTRAKVETCPCGTYQSWSIDVNAVGVPYGANDLGVIYRVQPGSGAWNHWPVLPITTGGSLPTLSGTMPQYSVIQSYGTLWINGVVEDEVFNSVGAG